METLDLSLDCVVVNITEPAAEGEVAADPIKIRFYPLNFKALSHLANDMETLRTGGGDVTRFEALCRILAASANRKSEVVTVEKLMDLMDPGMCDKILGKVNEISGMKKVAEDAAAKATTGNLPVPTSPQTGGESTQQS